MVTSETGSPMIRLVAAHAAEGTTTKGSFGNDTDAFMNITDIKK